MLRVSKEVLGIFLTRTISQLSDAMSERTKGRDGFLTALKESGQGFWQGRKSEHVVYRISLRAGRCTQKPPLHSSKLLRSSGIFATVLMQNHVLMIDGKVKLCSCRYNEQL